MSPKTRSGTPRARTRSQPCSRNPSDGVFRRRFLRDQSSSGMHKREVSLPDAAMEIKLCGRSHQGCNSRQRLGLGGAEHVVVHLAVQQHHLPALPEDRTLLFNRVLFNTCPELDRSLRNGPEITREGCSVAKKRKNFVLKMVHFVLKMTINFLPETDRLKDLRLADVCVRDFALRIPKWCHRLRGAPDLS